MSYAGDLIERLERETGQRIDDPNSFAMAGLFGAVAREMGKTNLPPQDDVAAGTMILHQFSPEYERQQQSRAMLADMLRAGFPPDILGALGK